MDNRLQTIQKDIRTNKIASTTTNTRSETLELQHFHSSELETDWSIRVRASNLENSDSENEDNSLRPSGMKNLRHPAKPLYKSDLDLDATIVSNEDSEEDDCHNLPMTPVRYKDILTISLPLKGREIVRISLYLTGVIGTRENCISSFFRIADGVVLFGEQPFSAVIRIKKRLNRSLKDSNEIYRKKYRVYILLKTTPNNQCHDPLPVQTSLVAQGYPDSRMELVTATANTMKYFNLNNSTDSTANKLVDNFPEKQI